MKKIYESPQVEIVKFKTTGSLITTSIDGLGIYADWLELD